MALIKCTACQADISAKAPACPKCGHPNPKAKHLSAGSVIAIFFFAGIGIWWLYGGGLQHATDKQMKNIEGQVANDMIQQYQIAKREGDPIQICVHAGAVSAAYLQAKDESNYRIWKKTERSACEAAGVPMPD